VHASVSSAVLAEVRAAAVVARGADGAAPGVWVKSKFGFGMAGVGGVGRVPNVGRVDEVAAG